jgi:hypothetical protein
MLVNCEVDFQALGYLLHNWSINYNAMSKLKGFLPCACAFLFSPFPHGRHRQRHAYLRQCCPVSCIDTDLSSLNYNILSELSFHCWIRGCAIAHTHTHTHNHNTHTLSHTSTHTCISHTYTLFCSSQFLSRTCTCFSQLSMSHSLSRSILHLSYLLGTLSASKRPWMHRQEHRRPWPHTCEAEFSRKKENNWLTARDSMMANLRTLQTNALLER